MKKYLLLLFASIIAAGSEPALANNPPGPMVALPEILLLPFMLIFSLLGGAYIILDRDQPLKEHGWLVRISCSIVAIVFSSVHETLGAAVAVTFGIMALLRGIQMVRWGFASKQPGIIDVLSLRLTTCGITLSAIAIYLTGMSIAFVLYWPEYRNNDDDYLIHFLTYQLAFAKCHQESTGSVLFQHVNDQDEVWQFLERRKERNKPETFRIEYAKDDTGFNVLVLPRSLPFFPYNFLVSQPSFRADGSGKIRMILVHSTAEQCPTNAPVVFTVPESDVSTMLYNCKMAREYFHCLNWVSVCSAKPEQDLPRIAPDNTHPSAISNVLEKKWERRRGWLRGVASW